MSEDQQRAEKSALLLEWTENKQELQCLRAVAARLSELFAYVADILRREPELLIFPGESTSLRYVRRDRKALGDISGLNLEEVKRVRDAIRELVDRQSELEPRMRAFNLL